MGSSPFEFFILIFPTKFIYDNGIVRKDRIKIEILDGIKAVNIVEKTNNNVSLVKVNTGRPLAWFL